MAQPAMPETAAVMDFITLNAPTTTSKFGYRPQFTKLLDDNRRHGNTVTTASGPKIRALWGPS
ncbi:hypothetical protein KCP73_13445 [Salmonella enterica subsp. enterica]|nr:hypothetical protein KCP73_13445 [Salmonella enterica subsp. enterica]